MSRLTLSRALLVLSGFLMLGLALGWLARKPLADTALRRALADRGVEASYDVKSIGLRWQRIENLRLGDAAKPDLTADWVELRLTGGIGGVSATAIRAGGVRLRGRFAGGRLTFGALDRLLPKAGPPAPFSLPNLDVDLRDARMSLATPYGAIGAQLNGKGNLTDGFAGKLAAIAPNFATPECSAVRTTAYVDILIRNRAPNLNGPLRADHLTCQGVLVASPAIALNVTLNAAVNRLRGSSNIEARTVTAAGAVFALLSGTVGFDGTADEARGTFDLSAQSAKYRATRFSGLSANGGFKTGGRLQSDGTVRVEKIVPDPAFAAQVTEAADGARVTPVGPILAQLAQSVRAASASGITATADVSLANGATIVSKLVATSGQRAALRLDGGRGLQFGSQGFVVDTQLSLSGGGFPKIESTFRRRPDGMTSGLARISAMSAGGSQLVVTPVRFAARQSGAMLFETTATLDGPIGDGRVTGLRAPLTVDVSSSGAVTVNRGCTPVAVQAVTISGLSLQPANLRLCPIGSALFQVAGGRIDGGATISAPRLSGRIGGTPISLAASGARATLGTAGFAVDGLTVDLGGADQRSRLQIGDLSGRIAGANVQGSFKNTSGKIANVPLLIDQSAGTWTLRKGALAVRGGTTVSDELVPARFNPLIAHDVDLRFADGNIAVTGTLRAPNSGVEVAKVIIAHDLTRETGSALINVASLRFNDGLQPEQLTPLTLGVIANVSGEIVGQGDIRWNAGGVTSTGRFGTTNMDFAAAFGPVSGLQGEIVFDDLLALTTPPGQRVTITSINPGTLVSDGVITYRLLPNQQLAIERGDWPFAGGHLLLDPTVLDMGKPSERRLTFHVVGLDAAKFIQHLEFENLAATGIFDGVLPMIFNEDGGRIEAGRLVVRREGGTLAYVGEVSNTAMNVYAKLAFDALKSIKYRNLSIELNGALDGEIVSQVNFSGTNESPLIPPKSFIARRFVGLPFKFNITIKAPFRSLLNTARTFQDPSLLIQQTIPRKPVQPAESETKP